MGADEATSAVGDQRNEVREFLATRRAKISPERAGLVSLGQRRVVGLRRNEVAQLAGVSVEYYTRVERGNLAGVSGGVLDAIADALQLDEAEREHLADLARTACESGRQRQQRQDRRKTPVRPSLGWMLDGMPRVPAFVRNGRLDVLAINDLGRALYAPAYRQGSEQPVNLARFCYLDPASASLYADWGVAADVTVRLLRLELGRDPHNSDLTHLIGQLASSSAEFSRRWAAHDVRLNRAGTKRFTHPVVGDLELAYDALEVPGDTGVTFTAYTAAPGSHDHVSLQLLATWAATESRCSPAASTNPSSTIKHDQPPVRQRRPPAERGRA